MDTSKAVSSGVSGNSRTLVGVSFGMLLFLRFGLLAAVGSFSRPSWLSPTFELGTYFFTLLLIWLERNRLRSFFMNELTLLLILALKPLETILLLRYGSINFLSIRKPGGLIVAALSLVAAAAYIAKRSEFDIEKLKPRNLKFLLLGMLVGTGLAAVLSVPMSFQVDPAGLPFSLKNLLSVRSLLDIAYQSGYAAVSEEPLFRGFLCGYLIMKGVKSSTVILSQALLFTMGHAYYVATHPLSFFIIVPVAALVLGFSAIKTKTINTSIAVHGTVNGIGYQMGAIAASLRTML